MIVNEAQISALFTGFKTAFNMGGENVKSFRDTISMKVVSTSREENYGWLAQLPNIRKWIGDRVVNNLSVHGYTIKNEKFESTVEISRDDIADDKVGLFAPVISEMGRAAKTHPDELLFSLLAQGFTTRCYDGQYFFDTDHQMKVGGAVVSASNFQAPTDPENPSTPWFLIDASRMVRPLVFQEREDYRLQQVNQDSDHHVFMTDKFLYGVRARVNAGFGLWQLAFGSKKPLTKDNYEAARLAMQNLKGDEGRPLGISPTHLIVPSSLEGDGRRVVVAQTLANGASNEWAGSAELIVSPWL
jgi:phage major head subunit gpT-like protein